MSIIQREFLLELVGDEAVNKLESTNCGFSHGINDNGMVKFSSTIEAKAIISDADIEKGDEFLITVFYYQPEEFINDEIDLSDLDWEIHHYEIQAA